MAIGEVLRPATRFDEAEVLVDDEWVRLADQDLNAPSGFGADGTRDSDDEAEYVVPVRWHIAVPKSEAFWVKGMFANQNSACKLRQEFTLDRLAGHFELDQIEEN